MAEWSRVLSTTIREFIRKVEINILRNRKLLAMMQKKGRFSFGHSGESMQWPVQFAQVPLTGYADMDVITFSRQDLHKNAVLPWRGYALQNALSKKEKLMNSGTEAIVKLYSGMTERMMTDFKAQFGEQYYVDGTTAANAKKMHGIESFMGTGGSASVATGYASPSQTFAGLATDLANYAGTWTGSWPDGTGDPSYDFWAPIVILYGSTTWTGTGTWASDCLTVMRAGILASQRNSYMDGQMDTIFLERSLYRQALEKMAANERIIVDRGQKSALVELGFRDVFNLDGVDVTWEYGVPANVGYGLNFEMVETRSLQDALIDNDGPDYDVASKTWRFSLDSFLNTIWNPRGHLKFQSA